MEKHKEVNHICYQEQKAQSPWEWKEESQATHAADQGGKKPMQWESKRGEGQGLKPQVLDKIFKPNSDFPRAQPNSNSDSTQDSTRIRFGTAWQAVTKKAITFTNGVRFRCSCTRWKDNFKGYAMDLVPPSNSSRIKSYDWNNMMGEKYSFLFVRVRI